MTVTPNSDAAPWDGGPRDPYQSPPVQPPVAPVRSGRGGRLRWLVALLATIIVVGAIGGVFLLANPPSAAGGVSPLARFAPQGSAAYAELRLDLPGDQRDHVVSFMSHFPGFADPATFDRKVSDTIDQLMRSDTTDVGWKADIEPWFGGQVVVFASTLEDDEGTPQSGTVVLSVKDRAALDAFLEKERAARNYETSEYRGVTVWTARISGERAAIAALDDALLVSYRVEDLHAALDVNAGARESLDDDDRFVGAMADLSGDRLAALYLDGDQLRESIETMNHGMPMLGGGWAAGLEQFPSAMVGQLRAEDDHLVFDMRLTPRAGQTFPNMPQNRTSTLAAQFPASVVGYAEVRDLGAGLKQVIAQMLELYVGVGANDDSMRQFEQFLGTRPEDFLDFLGDTAFAVSADGDRYGGGLIATVTDEAVARQRMERLVSSLRTMIAFAGPDVPLTIEEETHAGATLTVFRLRGDVPGMGDVPISSLSYTVVNGRLYLGADDFVKSALDRAEAGSLAGDAAYRRVLAAAGESNGGLLYLNIGQLRRIVENEIPASERAKSAEVWPFFERFSHVISTTASDGDDLVARFLLFVE